jgi:hypothetical protein
VSPHTQPAKVTPFAGGNETRSPRGQCRVKQTRDMRLPCQPSAVHDEICSCDVGGATAAEEHGCVGDVLRFTQSRPRCPSVGIFQQRGILADTRPAGLNFSGRNAVADDQLRGVVAGDLAGDVNCAGFADAVGCFARTRHDALLGTEVDDPAACFVPRFLTNHLLDGAFASVKHACEIDAHDLLPLRVGGIEEGGSGGDCGVVDHYVEATETRYGSCDQSIDLIPLPNVDLLKETLTSGAVNQIERRLTAFEGFSSYIGERNTGPFLGVGQGDGAPDSGAGPGHDGDAAREQFRHFTPRQSVDVLTS